MSIWRAALTSVAIVALCVSFAHAEESAKQHFAKGTAAYKLGHYAEAAHEFEAAYELRQDSTLLFNVAQAHRFAGELEQALVAYRSYLRDLPDAPNRPQVEASITSVQAQLDARVRERPVKVAPAPVVVVPAVAPPVVAAPVVVVAAPPRPQPVYKKWWVWTAVGAVVVVGLGVGLGVGLTRHHDEPIFPAGQGAQ